MRLQGSFAIFSMQPSPNNNTVPTGGKHHESAPDTPRDYNGRRCVYDTQHLSLGNPTR